MYFYFFHIFIMVCRFNAFSVRAEVAAQGGGTKIQNGPIRPRVSEYDAYGWDTLQPKNLTDCIIPGKVPDFHKHRNFSAEKIGLWSSHLECVSSALGHI